MNDKIDTLALRTLHTEIEFSLYNLDAISRPVYHVRFEVGFCTLLIRISSTCVRVFVFECLCSSVGVRVYLCFANEYDTSE